MEAPEELREKSHAPVLYRVAPSVPCRNFFIEISVHLLKERRHRQVVHVPWSSLQDLQNAVGWQVNESL